MEKRTIIGIDPGTNLLGFGVIDVVDGKPFFVDMGVLDIRKEKDAYSKLRQIYDTVSEVCKTYHGTEMALESPFYGKNAQVVLKLETLDVEIKAEHLDATDALAIALCHYYSTSSPLAKVKSSSSWEKFIQANPDRVK